MKGNETRAEIVRIGAEVIGAGGFNATGIDAVLKRAKVPKGSFYYYFSSKDEFGLAVINQAARDYEEKLQKYLTDRAFSPLARVRNFLEDGIKNIEENRCKRGCLMGNLGQELASQNEKFRKRLDEVFQGWKSQYAECFEEAKSRQELSRELESMQLAEFLLIGWEGAILRSKVMKSVKPLQDFVEVLFKRVLK